MYGLIQMVEAIVLGGVFRSSSSMCRQVFFYG